jgi:hypothetical protein
VNGPKPATTALQFPLRNLALIVLTVAVLQGTVSPRLREFSPAQLWRFCGVWLVGLAGMTTIVASSGALLRRAETRGGIVYFEVRAVGGTISRYIFSALTIVNVGVLFVIAFLAARTKADLLPLGMLSLLAFGPGVGTSFTRIWWKDDRIQLCEHGLRYWLHFMPWKSLREWRWADDGRRLMIVFRRRFAYVRMIVPEAERDAMDAFLVHRRPQD